MTIHVNEGRADRIGRAAIGLVLLLAGFSGLLPPALGLAALLAALLVLASALTGWCPIYTLLHVDTTDR